MSHSLPLGSGGPPNGNWGTVAVGLGQRDSVPVANQIGTNGWCRLPRTGQDKPRLRCRRKSPASPRPFAIAFAPASSQN